MLISAIMLTYNRRRLLPVALASYLAQDWTEKELIVVDDGEDAVEDLVASVPNCTYVRVPRQKTVADKANLACERARGEIIATWDDDDWSASGRMTQQANLLITSGKALTGYSTMFYWDGQKAWRYLGFPEYATGLSQVYRRDFWQQHKFEPKNVGYDNDLWASARQSLQCITTESLGMMVGRIHASNVSPKDTRSRDNWQELTSDQLPAEFFQAIQ